MFKKSVAVRENVKLKIGLAGPSGSGKTYSALQLAYGMTGDWSKVAFADTENKSGKYYAHLGPWQHIPFDPEEFPEDTYHPLNWVKLIEFVEKDPTIEVLILDSISHEWEGRGGCLDAVDQINKGFAGWKVVTPLHNRFMDALRNSKLHIIATMRTKTDYVVEANDKGKVAPKKVGLKSNQREGTDYEFGIVFDIEINHHASSSKDRTGLFAKRREFVLTPAIGKELMEWATSGASRPQGQTTTLPIVYTATNEQKTVIRDLFAELGFDTRSKETGKLMKECSDACVEAKVTLAALRQAVTEFVNDQQKLDAAKSIAEGVFDK